MKVKNGRMRVAATLAIGALVAIALTSSPASSHVAGWDHNWNVHIKPRADARYLQVSTKLKPGQKLTGVYSAWGIGGGYIGDAVTFRVPLTADLDGSHVQYITIAGGPSTQCPGQGQATAGYLCVYEMGVGNATFQQIYASGNLGGGSGSSKEGFGILFDTSGTTGAWSYGEWTVRAPAATAKPTTGSNGGSTPA